MSVDLTSQIHQYLTSAPGSLFAQQPVEILDHWQGDANLLWRVEVDNRQAVVKLFLDAGQARSRRQYDAHQLFAPVGLAPTALWADRYPHGLSRQLIVYEWVAGDAVQPGDEDALIACSEAVAALHMTSTAQVRRFSPHPVNLDYFWRIEQVTIAQVEAWLAQSGLALAHTFTSVSTACESLIAESLPLWGRVQPAPVHGDLTFDHAHMARGKVLLLDWEMFGLGDAAMDVARLLLHEAQSLTPAMRELWLGRYIEMVDQPLIAERIAIFERLLELHNVLYLLAGLRQHTEDGLAEELRASLPYIGDALQASLVRVTNALLPTADVDVAQNVADFVKWLDETVPTLHKQQST